VNWADRAAAEAARYEDGAARLPEDPRRRERQLVRMAIAAGAAGLALVMDGRDGTEWFRRSADAYRASFAPGAWGRAVGAVKSGILSGDAREDAEWVGTVGSDGSAIAGYAEILARLALGEDAMPSLTGHPDFPADVAAALDALALRDADAYREAVASVLASFETREAYLEDLPVADTVLVLERLAAERGIAAGLESPLLPRPGAR
jgi:hypothetical protein